MRTATWTYSLVVVGSLLAVWLIVSGGSMLHPVTAGAPTVHTESAQHGSPIVTLLVQIVIILTAGRLMGQLCKLIGQPQVIGEMLAGIMLGPSLFGLVAPHAWEWVFPAQSLPFLGLLSQLGVILFLFLIGLELDPKLLRNRGHAAVLISHASIAVPFVMGTALTLYLYPKFFRDQPGMEFTPVALFMGAAMSVTAFPVLARMLTERNLHRTELGAVAITCAAIDDASAWCMLAVVIGISRADGIVPGLITAGGAVAYVLAMILLVRPLMQKLQKMYEHQGRLSQTIVGFIFMMVLLSAWVTEKIGIHALFGAFMMGAIMPKGTQFVRMLSDKLEDFTITFLLPVFFANAGLKTQIGLLKEPGLWMQTGLIILVATAGKFGGSAIAGRISGMSWRDASVIGILMNTRGLMELVILEIGLEEGVLTPTVFAMMVIMALVTTGMTSPLLHWFAPQSRMPTRSSSAGKGFDMLVPVAAPESGPSLARVAAAIIGNGQPEPGRLLALHLVRPPEEQFGSGLDDMEFQRDEALAPLLAEARNYRLATEPISFATRDVPTDIAAVAKGRGASMVLMGFHKPLIGTEILGGTVHRVLQATPTDMGIFVDRGLQRIESVLVAMVGSPHDALALRIAERMNRVGGAAVTVIHVVPPNRTDSERVDAKTAVDQTFLQPSAANAVTLKVIIDDNPVDAVLKECPAHSLVIIGVDESLGLDSHLFGWRPQRIVDESPTSLLIVRKFMSGKHN